MLRFARCCYDHLVRPLGVAMTAQLLSRGLIVPATKHYDVMRPALMVRGLGLNIETLKPSRARACLDWTERTRHLA